MTTVAILQSNYIPWRGYFDLIRQADHFVFYDEVQYTKNDWRNRNVIVPPTGKKWLTLPVETSGKFGQAVDEARIKDPEWATKHLDVICQVYRKSTYSTNWLRQIEGLYTNLRSETNLSVVNQTMIREISAWLGLRTQFHDSRAIPGVMGKTDRLVGIVSSLSGTRYLSGQAAKSYLDVSMFAAEGLEVAWMQYPAYASYTQLDGGYQAGVTILDTLLNAGAERVFAAA